MDYDGPLSYDTIHLGSNELKPYLFEEWTASYCIWVGCIEAGYDGVLGLAPPWFWFREGLPNVLASMQSQKVLKSDVFSLRLPHSMEETGELLLGGANPTLYEGEPTWLPLAEVNDTSFAGTWAVSASAVHFDTPKPLHLDLSNTTVAILDTARPYILLPWSFGRKLLSAIGAEEGPAWFYNIPCSRRAYLPHLTFTLGGHSFSISAFEYTVETDMFPVGLVCLVMFQPMNWFNLPQQDNILLGSGFLKKFYSVWDFGEQRVGCESCSRYSARIHRLKLPSSSPRVWRVRD